ncbi:uncharacterized protein LY89DRAFT_723506 [Mollisia scopiformis]|uniref:DUF2415 domain-containing protein n=1 Tax=Mollisia scopiformis TaxID=149040 RepID=A0A132BCW8_MOLSC|nr:uncharacterized protein LY89DRAFT_723506 [Mollisia scopiformis]KUJ10246.1 hypothetical protein LY89DRAFT_723506 [Mollisia scopiformis]
MAAMAVKSESLHHATEALILPQPRKFYRAAVETSHWQLRSLISSPESHIVYYPSGSEVFSLNTKTQEREVIAKLPFLPRCLIASKDWLCCGAESGQYVSISLKDRAEDRNLIFSGEADPDERLPLDLDPTRRSTTREANSSIRRSPSRPLQPTPIKIGTEIVNCVTLWSPGEMVSEKAYDIPVAVVANNDCTVSIVNVRDSEVLEKLTLPDFVNRSVISPDGEILVTICDDPFLYIHQRTEKIGFRKQRFGTKDVQRYEWVLAGKIQLEGQRTTDKSENRGSFTACFSPSGRYLAVATQYGVISIFDAQRLTDHDSLLVIFTTSRPGASNGAVRSMEFSPAPFDLLAWTEHSGRIGVADVRSLFYSRQLIRINSDGEGVETVNVSDRRTESFIDPRLLNVRNESPSSHSSTPDYLGLDLERRQLRHLTREMLDRHHTPVTVEELEVLQAHRIARRQRDAANAAREALAEGSGRWSAWGDGQRSSTASGEGPGSTSRRISTSGLPAALREFVNPDRTAASFRSFINERNRENERRSQLQQEPRRRASMILAAAENAIERETLGTGARPSNDTSTTLERLTLTPSRLETFGSDSPNNPWAEIDALYRSRFPGDPPLDRSTRLRVEVAADEEPRDFAHRLRQPWRPLDDLGSGTGIIPGGGGLRAPETMGCAWSSDGRILYVGAQDGIHEYHVNVPARKKFPSLVMR